MSNIIEISIILWVTKLCIIKHKYNTTKNLWSILDHYIILLRAGRERSIYYCLKVYEQLLEFENDPNSNKKHVEFWKNEMINIGSNRDSFSQDRKKARQKILWGYPISLNFECTTYCNAKCKNCTHDTLIKEKKRKLKNITIQEAIYIIKKFKLWTLWNNVPENKVHIVPVGLGEPLLHPSFFEICQVIRKNFNKSTLSFNTNAILLNENNIKKILRGKFDHITLGLSYFEKEIYEEQIGVNAFDKVVENIQRFLIKRGNARKPICKIHILGDELNGRKEQYKFKKYFRKFIRNTDILNIRPYYKIVEGCVNESNKKYPCEQLWSTIMVDIDGNCFPCCLGVWKEYDKMLAIGNIRDSIADLNAGVYKIREAHMKGKWGTCLQCVQLYNKKK